jgi:HSP20 family protein
VSEKGRYQFRVLKNTWALTRDYPSQEKVTGIPGETESPKLDLYETETDVITEVDLPGMDPQCISIQLLDNRLILEGKQDCRPGPGNYIRMERSQEDFRRLVDLPCAVDPQNAGARYEKGVLILKLPKITDRRKRGVRIPVQ